jgi:hypothetical protein
MQPTLHLQKQGRTATFQRQNNFDQPIRLKLKLAKKNAFKNLRAVSRQSHEQERRKYFIKIYSGL